MNETQNTGFAERLKTAAEAKKALLAKFRPKPTVVDPLASERVAMRAAALTQTRADHAAAKAAVKQAAADAQEAVRQAQADAEAADLDARRGVRKERKALTKAEAKTKRDARYAARKARQ
ncbi:MAG TPA: DUF6481 family protein [Caulobacteraceae bacterium]|jgi:hypothetical protein|nr:DUF6481 family protein [Caulobacteraceae bacterium]